MKIVTKIIEILFRIAVSPLVLSIVIVYLLKGLLTFLYHYFIYGGELISYRKGNRETNELFKEYSNKNKEEAQ